MDSPAFFLVDLPEGLFYEILGHLDPVSIFRLHACSKGLQQAAGADVVWKPICINQGWELHPRSSLRAHVRPFCAHYAAMRRTLCVECLRPTQYCFKLLNCRLCMDCEPQHTKYNLVTKREACEGVGIAPELCDTLPFVISCGMPFYLRTAVLGLEAAQQSGRRTVQRAGAGVDSSEEEDEGDFQCCGDSDGMNGYMSGLEEHQASKEQAAAEKAAAAAARKAEDKATRKATKKQAKQDQRAKRQGGCTDPSPHKSAQSNLDLHTRQAEGAHSIPSGRPSRTSKGSSPSGSFWSQEGSSNGRQGAGPSARRAGGGTRSSFGGRSLPSRSRISTTPPLEGQARGLQRTPPRASGWLQEREAIMQEFGPYSISGLVLVS